MGEAFFCTFFKIFRKYVLSIDYLVYICIDETDNGVGLKTKYYEIHLQKSNQNKSSFIFRKK